MHFRLIDRILELRAGEEITACKALALSEDYLKDHFPLFPVMPGVLMLEAMHQASEWLVRVTDDFQHSMVVLREVRNIRYADFVTPGQLLVVQATIQKRDGNKTWLRAQGTVDDRVAVGARLILESYNLADQDPRELTADAYAIKHLRKAFATLGYKTPQVAGDDSHPQEASE